MGNVRRKLITKIEKDCGILIPLDSTFYRPTLTWQHLSAGRFKWYFVSDAKGQYFGIQIGSAENMTELLKSPRIICDFGESHWGFYELSSS